MCLTHTFRETFKLVRKSVGAIFSADASVHSDDSTSPVLTVKSDDEPN